MLDAVYGGLRPGGCLILIDFDLRKDSSEFLKQRARSPKEVYFQEFVDASFEGIETKNAPKLNDNVYAEFRRVERTPNVHVAPSKGNRRKP